jgi:hypothetical protein
MKHVSMREFVETGEYGGARLGIGRAELQALFGEPDDLSGASRKYRKPAIWKYGDVEFHFGTGADELWLIHLDDFVVPQGGKSIEFDPWIINGSLTPDEAQSVLAREGMQFAVKNPFDLETVELVVGPGVRLLFSEGLLCAVSYSGSRVVEAP